jgi:hypothetical protein
MQPWRVLVLLAATSLYGCGGDSPEYDPTVIARQPINQTVQAGQAATFDVLTAGDPPAGYPWYRDLQPITGATTFSYTTPPTTTADNGAQFEVLIYVRGRASNHPGAEVHSRYADGAVSRLAQFRS